MTAQQVFEWGEGGGGGGGPKEECVKEFVFGRGAGVCLWISIHFL